MLRVDSVDHTFPPSKGLQRLLIRGASEEAVPVLHHVDLQVDAGEIVGLVGPNGAGKTTLIKIISTLLTPGSGRVTVDGFDTVSAPLEVRRRLGLVLADDRSIYWRLSGRDNLEFFGAMYGLSRAEARRRSAELMERVGLDHRDKLVFGYSSGMRARMSIARALLHRPPLLLLDEPTRALDPLATADVGALLRNLAGGGAAVLLSSHRLDELEQVCDRIVVLTSGVVRFTGTPAELSGATGFADSLRALLAADDGNEGAR
jgi:ABC-2 type transport system ATP-binding protein